MNVGTLISKREELLKEMKKWMDTIRTTASYIDSAYASMDQIESEARRIEEKVEDWQDEFDLSESDVDEVREALESVTDSADSARTDLSDEASILLDIAESIERWLES